MATLKANNIAPRIGEWTGQFPDDGGAVVLVGKSESGKSRFIQAVMRMLTANKNYEVAVADGAESAQLEFAGGRMKVGNQVRILEKSDYIGIDSQFLNILIDPQLKDPDAADEARIEAVVELLGLKADCSLFYPNFKSREEFDSVVEPDICEETSLVKQANLIKRACHASARGLEKEADREDGQAIAARGASADLDMEAECDSKVLQLQLEKAIQHESNLRAQDAAAAQAEARKLECQVALEKSEREYTGKTVEQATATWNAANRETTEATAERDRLKALLAEAEVRLRTAAEAEQRAIDAGKSARQHEETVKAWRESLASSVPPRPTADELDKSSQRVQDARKAVETGALVRKAKEQGEAVKKHAEAAKQLRDSAKRLRDAADATDDVLSKAVADAKCPLKVRRGRLVSDTERKEKELFSERSTGARAKIAIDIAVASLPPGKKAILGVAQGIWGELSPSVRLELAEHAKANGGAIIFTGLCTDDDNLGMEVLP